MTSPDARQPDTQNDAQRSPPTLDIRKARADDFLGLQQSSRAASANSTDASRARGVSAETSLMDDAYDSLTRSPMLSPTLETGLHRIRQNRPGTAPHSPESSKPPSRVPSLGQISSPSSSVLPVGEDLARYPSESLHSFSFTHRSSEDMHTRQKVLKRSLEFMRDKLGWAASSPRIASAQARLAGDEELASMLELLQKASLISPTAGTGDGASGLGIDRGPLTGPAHMTNENIFDQSFQSPTAALPQSPTSLGSAETIAEEPEEDELIMPPVKLGKRQDSPSKASPVRPSSATGTASGDDARGVRHTAQRPQRLSLKRTFTDVAGYSLQQRLTEAMSQPYRESQSPSMPEAEAATFQPGPLGRASTLAVATERASHSHRNRQAQAIFMTEARAPWTITSANDLACLVFGVTRAEVRKLGIMEVIKKERRSWLEERLRDPESGTSPRLSKAQAASPPGKPSQSGSAAAMGNGITAKLLSKPASRYSSSARRSKTVGSPQLQVPTPSPNHNANKSRGVLLCGDVVPIQKMNGSTGSASLWVKEKGGGLIWVLEEIAEDVAYLSVDAIGSVHHGSGAIEPIWGLERVRNGMDVQKLIPAFPKLAGTNTGAIDYEAVARLRHFTARTANSISIPITVDQLSGDGNFRISSFPHIAGIIVLNPSTMRISSSNSVFSSALFGYSSPDGMPITDLIPGFDSTLRVMTDEDNIALVDGIVIPEHSFRRARALLALREGSGEAAAIFLRPSGVLARHRDGAEIMVDVQMRVVKSDRDPIYHESGGHNVGAAGSLPRGELVYALWITYSRQLHATHHGIGPVTPMISRSVTPPEQPRPGSGTRHHVDSSVPSPQVTDVSYEEEPLRTKVMRDQLDQSQTIEGTASPSAVEPYEHPSPDMTVAGAKTVPRKSIDDFNILEEMGQGAYGQVKLARYKRATSEKMVIKYVTKRRILVDTWHRDRRLGTVPLEIHVLDYLRRDGLQHPNIVEMADFFEDDVNYYIEMIPHGLPGMDLFDYIELRVTMDEAECRKIFRQVAGAIAHLHVVAKVVHRDIKDENVVLDGEGRVKLVDFGSAAYIKSGPFDVFVGTIDYAAPEVLRGSPYRGKEQDVWALGILLYTIVYKENPFYSIDEIMDHDLRVPYVLSEDCIDLIRRMLDRNVERRIGIQAVLEHPWCQTVDEEGVKGEREVVPGEGGSV